MIPGTSWGQVSINTDGTAPSSSAMLDIKSTMKGFLAPRMTQVQREAISSPAIGLLVYQIDVSAGFYYYTGSAWLWLGGSNAQTLQGKDTSTIWKVNGIYVLKVPNQTTLTGTIYYGDGGASLLHNGGTESGMYNTYSGIGAGYSTTRAKKNTGFGYQALYNDTSGWDNTAFGYKALSAGAGLFPVDGLGGQFYANTAVGESALGNTTTGSYNSAVGANSLFTNTTGQWNTAIGVHSLNFNTSGTYNTGIGYYAGYSNRTGVGNVALGAVSLRDNYRLDDMIAIGRNSLLVDTSGSGCIAIGKSTLMSNYNGGSNVAIGYNALQNTNNGAKNVAIGYQAGYTATYSEKNTLIGCFSGYSLTSSNSTNTFIGYSSGYNAGQKVNAVNSTAIGNEAYTTASNQVVIGNTSVTETILRGNTKSGAFQSGVITQTIIDSTRIATQKLKLTGTDTTGLGGTPNIGRMMYYNGHFYGVVAGVPPAWVQLDN